MTALLRRALPADQDAYGWELKWDGVRAVAYVQQGGLRLTSRNDKDITRSYPELAGLARMLPRAAILDGEIVALRDGRPSFATLQLRMHVQHPAERLVRSVPVQYYLFDLLPPGGGAARPPPHTRRAGPP